MALHGVRGSSELSWLFTSFVGLQSFYGFRRFRGFSELSWFFRALFRAVMAFPAHDDSSGRFWLFRPLSECILGPMNLREGVDHMKSAPPFSRCLFSLGLVIGLLSQV